ncbi:unnamed protein product [Prunus armeniaca]
MPLPSTLLLSSPLTLLLPYLLPCSQGFCVLPIYCRAHKASMFCLICCCAHMVYVFCLICCRAHRVSVFCLICCRAHRASVFCLICCRAHKGLLFCFSCKLCFSLSLVSLVVD